MDLLVSRLKEFLDYKGITVKQLTAALNYSAGEKIYRLFRDKKEGEEEEEEDATKPKKPAKPSVNFLEDVSLHFPELNMNWVISGNGNMLKEKTGQEKPVDKYVIVKQSFLDSLERRMINIENTASANYNMITEAVQGLIGAREAQLVSYSLLLAFQEYWLEQAHAFFGGIPAEDAQKIVDKRAYEKALVLRQAGITLAQGTEGN